MIHFNPKKFINNILSLWDNFTQYVVWLNRKINWLNPFNQFNSKAESTASKTETVSKTGLNVVKISTNIQIFGKAFVVKEIAKPEWRKLVHSMDSWILLAQKLYLKVHNGSPPIYRTRDAALNDPGAVFLDSISILGSIRSTIDSGAMIEPCDVALIFEDKNAEIQAIALAEKNTCKLAFIATNPKNIRHEVNDESQIVHGAALGLILKLAEWALQTEKPICTRSLKNAVHFYKKIGFIPAPEDSGPYDGYKRIEPMKLTIEKIKELMKTTLQK